MQCFCRLIVFALVLGQATAFSSDIQRLFMKRQSSTPSYRAESLFEEVLLSCEQVLWVEVKVSSDKEAVLHLMEREKAAPWKRLDSWKVKIGRKGVAPGIGKHLPRAGKLALKKEGDAKTPLGIFELPFVYGVAPEDAIAARTRMPYRSMTEHHAGVDDGKSRYYNQIVDAREVEKDWDSSEKMILKDGTYDWGIYVSHNPQNQAGMGSCIFIHLKKANGDSTSGCVAMSRAEMELLLAWMNPRAKPLMLVSLEDASES